MKGIIRHQPQHHWDISKPIDQVYGIMFDLDLFKGENDNEGFFDIIIHHTHATDIRVHRAGSQLKIVWSGEKGEFLMSVTKEKDLYLVTFFIWLS